MKLKLTFKTPDVLYQAAEQHINAYPPDADEADEEEYPYLMEEALETVKEMLEKWVRHEEFITIEFDTEAKTATVLEV